MPEFLTQMSRTSPESVDRVKMRQEWNTMRNAYHELVESIPPSVLKRPTIDTRWSVGEILVHMIQSLEIVPRGIQAVRQGKDFLNLPAPMLGVTNLFLVKIIARNSTSQRLLIKYNQAFNAAMQAWDGVHDDEWSKGARIFGEGYKTLRDYYIHAPAHFKEHSEQIRKSLLAVRR